MASMSSLGLKALMVALLGAVGSPHPLDIQGVSKAQGPKGTLESEAFQTLVKQYAEELLKPLEDRPWETHGNSEEIAFAKQKGTFTDQEVEFLTKGGDQGLFVGEHYDFEPDPAGVAGALPDVGSGIDDDDTDDPLVASRDHVLWLLNNVLNRPRNHERDAQVGVAPAKQEAAGSVWRKLGKLGYLTCLQTFGPQVFADRFQVGLDGKLLGTNIMAIAPGRFWGTKEDAIVVLAAHYDTVKASPGYNDNGSGVAVLLEIARAFSQASCKPDYTLIMAALDLEEYGVQGARAFVQRILVQEILQRYGFPRVQGAYVLDSLLNFNSSENSQRIPKVYRDQIEPDFLDRLRNNKAKGDFYSVVGRPFDDLELYHRFKAHYDRVLMTTSGPKGSSEAAAAAAALEWMGMVDGREGGPMSGGGRLPDVDTLVNNIDLLRSDHQAFWLLNSVSYLSSFKAVHISDTGPERGIMLQCYHQECDSPELNDTVPYANLDNLMVLTQALIDTLVDLTGSTCSASTRRTPRSGPLSGNYTFQTKMSDDLTEGSGGSGPPKETLSIGPSADNLQDPQATPAQEGTDEGPDDDDTARAHALLNRHPAVQGEGAVDVPVEDPVGFLRPQSSPPSQPPWASPDGRAATVSLHYPAFLARFLMDPLGGWRVQDVGGGARGSSSASCLPFFCPPYPQSLFYQL